MSAQTTKVQRRERPADPVGWQRGSSLTRMSDFKVLKREDMQRVVSEGRVGGVPRLGDLRRWVRPQLADSVPS